MSGPLRRRETDGFLAWDGILSLIREPKKEAKLWNICRFPLEGGRQMDSWNGMFYLCCGLSSVGWSKSVFDHLKLEAAQTPWISHANLLSPAPAPYRLSSIMMIIMLSDEMWYYQMLQDIIWYYWMPSKGLHIYLWKLSRQVICSPFKTEHRDLISSDVIW